MPRRNKKGTIGRKHYDLYGKKLLKELQEQQREKEKHNDASNKNRE